MFHLIFTPLKGGRKSTCLCVLMVDGQAEQGLVGLIPGAIVLLNAFASFSFWSRDLGTFQGFLAGIFFFKAFHRDRTLTGVEGGSASVGLSRERARHWPEPSVSRNLPFGWVWVFPR